MVLYYSDLKEEYYVLLILDDTPFVLLIYYFSNQANHHRSSCSIYSYLKGGQSYCNMNKIQEVSHIAGL